MQGSLWQQCLAHLENELPEQQFNTWIRPLHAVENAQELRLLAPNRFVLDWVRDHYISSIQTTLDALSQDQPLRVELQIGSLQPATPKAMEKAAQAPRPGAPGRSDRRREQRELPRSNLNSGFTFDSFVEGKSNQLARAASLQIAENPGKAYNPLFIYGGVGLGKTHLMHAIGNHLLGESDGADILYITTEQFVNDLVTSIREGKTREFRQRYRQVDLLLVDQLEQSVLLLALQLGRHRKVFEPHPVAGRMVGAIGVIRDDEGDLDG